LQRQVARDAAIEAMDEVGGALVGIALVLSAVFIPAAHGGNHRIVVSNSHSRIAFSVIVSAFNASHS